MDEQQAPSASPPVKRRQYSPELKQTILDAFAKWEGSQDEFCEKHGVAKVTLWAWRNGSKGRRSKKTETPSKKQSVYTPEQKRQAVETFAKSGQTLLVFGKLWGVHPGVLARWVRAYKKLGPKAFEGRRLGRKRGQMPMALSLRDGIVGVKQQFPDFGFRKVQGFLARFKGLQPSQPQIRRVFREDSLPNGKTAEKTWPHLPISH